MRSSEWGRDEVPLDKPSSARIYDYLLGGYHNFEADRAICNMMLEICPHMRMNAVVNRAFLRRVVNCMLEQGIDQLLDLGSGIPTVGNVHEIARAVKPEARVVYVDIDPVAVNHGRAMLADDALATIIRADVRDAEAIVAHPEVRELLDFERPLGILLVAILHFVDDNEEAYQSVRTFADSLAPGSYMAVSHTAAEVEIPGIDKLTEMFGKASTTVSRSRDQVMRFFEGFELLAPGLVFTPLWRPAGPDDPFLSDPERSFNVGGVGRKP
ncbi:MAG: SAM-dependent methyltransferase [Anaerolineae bacterium]|jgi:SAM-dependent methyltransferase